MSQTTRLGELDEGEGEEEEAEGEKGIDPKTSSSYQKICSRKLYNVFKNQHPTDGNVHVLVELSREFCHYSLTAMPLTCLL